MHVSNFPGRYNPPIPPFSFLQQDGIEPRLFTFRSSLQRRWLSWQQLWHAHLWFMHTEGCRSLRFSEQWRIIQCISAPMTLVLFIRCGLQSAAMICLTAPPAITVAITPTPTHNNPNAKGTKSTERVSKRHRSVQNRKLVVNYIIATSNHEMKQGIKWKSSQSRYLSLVINHWNGLFSPNKSDSQPFINFVLIR